MTVTTFTHMPIQEWITGQLDLARENPDEDWRYKTGIDQAVGFRDAIHPLLEPKLERRGAMPLIVVNTHTSKSRVLPVVRYVMDGRGHGVQWRNNFYNWSISCKLADYMPWPWDKMPVSEKDEKISACYCEGFLDEEVFGPYSESARKFTMQLHGSLYYPEYTLGMMFTWAFLWGREWNNPGNFYSNVPH